MLSGSIVAIVTPMAADGGLDMPGLKSLVDWHVAEGTDGIVIVGTTGESPTVDIEEHHRLIAATVEYAAGRVPVIAGAGGNATKEAVELTGFAKKAGADYVLSVVPYYNKPTQEGLFRHFKAIAESTDIPVLLYNVPSRTIADLSNDTVLRLAEGERHRRHQGSHRQRRPRGRADGAHAEGFPRLQRQRRRRARVRAAGRPWRDLGHRQRGAAPDA
jgi:4-hydroxy-tetrahydrodipicolinate synthase